MTFSISPPQLPLIGYDTLLYIADIAALITLGLSIWNKNEYL